MRPRRAGGSDRDEPRLGDHAERGMPSKATLGLRVGSADATIARSATDPPRKFAIASMKGTCHLSVRDVGVRQDAPLERNRF
jgi:hypothetical protein